MSERLPTHLLTESQEDYLEAIFRLSLGGEGARVTDIAEALRVSKPSVTVALKNLAKRGLVSYGAYSKVVLSGAGMRLAEEVSRIHARLKNILIGKFGLKPSRAELNACRMEHALDPDVMDRLLSQLEK